MKSVLRKTLLALLVVLILWAGVSLWRAGTCFAARPSKARYALVMDGQGPNGIRVPFGLALLRGGIVDTLVVSGSQAGSDVHYSTLWVRELELTEAERGRVLELRSNSTSTQDEARLADSLFSSVGADSVIVVTSDYHAWRTASVFRAVAHHRTVFSLSPAPDPYWAMGWADREGAKMHVQEWAKRISWVLIERWTIRAGRIPVSRLVRGEEMGRFPPPRWK